MPESSIVTAGQIFLTQTFLTSSFPISILLIGLEAVIEHEYVCPCRDNKLRYVTIAVILVPPVFVCALMCFYSKFSKSERINCKCSWECFMNYSIPVFVWIFIILLDGGYVACLFVHWDGQYVYDEKLKKKWCQPNTTETENELRPEYHVYLFWSQMFGYIVIGVLCILIFIACICGKSNPQETTHNNQEAVREALHRLHLYLQRYPDQEQREGQGSS